MIPVDSDEINKLQHYYDYMYGYIAALTVVFYFLLLSFGFMIKFVIIEINKRILVLKKAKNKLSGYSNN